MNKLNPRNGRSLLSRLTELKELTERRKQERDKAAGQLEALLDRLKRDFNVTSEEQGRKLLSKMEKELSGLERELEEGLDAFEKEHAEQFE